MGLTPGLMQLIAQAAQNQGTQPGPPLSVPGSSPSILPPQLFPQGQASPQGQPAGSASVLPPTSPLGANVEGLLAIPEYRKMIAEQDQTRQQLGAEMWRQKALATPASQVVPGTGQGGQPGLAGEMPKMQWGSKNKVLNALLAIAGATGPGQAIQAQMYREPRRSWEAQTKATADAIQDLKDQAAITGEQQKAVGTMALGAGNMAIKQQRADQQGQAIAQRYSVDLQRLQQGAQRLTLEQQGLALKQWFDKGLLEAMNARIAAGMDENSARISAQEDMKAAMSQNEWALKHPIWNAIGFAPTITGAPGAATTPVQPPAAPAAPANKANRINTIRNKTAPSKSKPGDPLGIL